MKLIDLTCPHCNAQLTVDDSRQFIFCEYCGAPERPEVYYERWLFEAQQIGIEPTDEVRRAFGLE